MIVNELLDEGTLPYDFPIERFDLRASTRRADPFEMNLGVLGEERVNRFQLLFVHGDVVTKAKILNLESILENADLRFETAHT
jgi:hypothetical protein